MATNYGLIKLVKIDESIRHILMLVDLKQSGSVVMSTEPEVIVAKCMGMQCLGLSVITDLGIEGKVEEVSHEAVQIAAKGAENDLSLLVKYFIKAHE